jgi:AcrR family transcriptional regulator
MSTRCAAEAHGQYREGMSGERRRGSYPKGIAKREEILERALEVIAREGYRGASIKELADAAGLSQAGLLHYFDSKEELFTAILRKRDQALYEKYGPIAPDIEVNDLRAGYLGVIQINSQVPGFVQLFSRLAVEGAEPEHPAHDFFLERGEWFREGVTTALTEMQRAGTITDAVEPEVLARIFQAVSDGLQVQWLQDPTVDMSAIVAGLFDALTPATVREPS